MNTFLFLSYSDNEYLLQKVLAYSKVGDQISDETQKILEYSASLITPVAFDFPVVDEETERSRLTPDQLVDIDNGIKMNLKLISRDFPLVANESILNDRFTALAADFMDFPKGTPVLIRQTNKSTMIHFFPCSVYRNGNLEQGDLVIESQGPVLLLNPDIKMKLKGPEDIIFSLFSGIASGIGNKIGAQIFDTVFPNNSSNLQLMLQNLEKNIKDIFRKELDGQTLQKLNLKILGVIQYMKETYLPQKWGGAAVDTLESMLTTENEKLYTDLMALLVGKPYRSQGISYLVVGANTHLIILQELASITKESKPKISEAYTTTYFLRLKEYITALTTAIEEVHTDRLTYLTSCQQSTLTGITTEKWWFVDNWSNYTSDSFSNTFSWDKKRRGQGDGWTVDAYKKANEARTFYFNTTFHPKIVTDLEIYVNMKNAWNKALGN